jgi:hypothetical protein
MVASPEQSHLVILWGGGFVKQQIANQQVTQIKGTETELL